MDSSRGIEFEARLARVEKSIALLQRSVDGLLDERKPKPPPIADRVFVQRQRAADGIGENLSSWFSSRSPEWWLSRVGIGFVVLAVLLLYKYAIDKGWITPPVRILAGIVVGGVLFWAATRTTPPAKSTDSRDLGLRELFFGGGLAVWYVTAYAAAVWYHVISIPSARLVFLLLAILSTWIALQERREVFGFLAVATGFATPFILVAPLRSNAELSLYLGAMVAIGLTIYLMRGWPSLVWITFAGFWLSVAGVTNAGARINPANGSLALTTLVILATAALVRVPTLRRELLLVGSDRYASLPISSGIRRLMHALDALAAALGGGGKSAPDSLVLWLVPLLSPILAADSLENIWPTAPKAIWGFGLLALGAGAFILARRGEQPGVELTQVEVTAAVLWGALGIERVASVPEGIPLASGLAALVLVSSEFVPSARPYPGARAVAKATIAIALLSIAGHELDFADVGLLHLRWVLSGIATIGCAALIAETLIGDSAERMQGIVLAVAGYLTGLVVIWRALEPVWAPLVTTSYAVAGALLLVISQRPGSNPLLKHLGGATMLLVVVRLLFVDLSSVEAIWRVLLFLVCGAVFLYTGYRMQLRPTAGTEK
jgi:hypothetical protein